MQDTNGDWHLRLTVGEIQLGALHENADFSMFFWLRDEDMSLSMNALVHPWPNMLL